MDESLQARICLVGHGNPCLKFFDWENARLHQETHYNVDDVRWGIWVLSNDLDLLALLCAIKEHFRGLSGGNGLWNNVSLLNSTIALGMP